MGTMAQEKLKVSYYKKTTFKVTSKTPWDQDCMQELISGEEGGDRQTLKQSKRRDTTQEI